ncbi:DNA polymerase [Favolaschia claudopus]|uniref:DNA polymerase delta catalytic subunit n=1 Tax=Favolaschia claudopus TaxID=2862362 RepID=A0AAW0DCR3_9AGAR
MVSDSESTLTSGPATISSTAAPLSQKRTERASSPGDPGDAGRPSDAKKARPLGPSQSFAQDLQAMAPNNSELAGPHVHFRGNGHLDCENPLSFQLLEVQAHKSEPSSALLFGVTKTGLRLLVLVKDIGGTVKQFMEQHTILAMCSVELPSGKYHEINEQDRLSHNQTELVIRHEDLVFHPAELPWKIADSVQLRILSFDIETLVPTQGFSNPLHNAVLQIGNILKGNGNESDSFRIIFTLRGCSAIAGAEVRSFQTEYDLLLAWRKFIIDCDPDMVTGHNIGCFDLMYLIIRARTLEVPGFACLGRLKDHNTEIVEQHENNGVPPGWQDAPVLPGRLQFDTLQYFKQRGQDVGCSLGTLAARYLGSNKESGVEYTMINRLQDGTNDDRRRLAVYCLKDCDLVLRLLFSEQNLCFEEAVTVARQSKSCRPFGSFLRCGIPRTYRPSLLESEQAKVDGNV